jgi:UDP-glucose 4-epimerase
VNKVLITGANGFIGSNLVRTLRNGSFEIRTLDISSSCEVDFNIDISEGSQFEKFEDFSPDVIVHAAAQVSVLDSFREPVDDLTVNGIGTLNLLNWGAEVNCKHFLYINSGGAIYDSESPLPIKETSPVNPISPYGLSKALAENYIKMYCERNNIKWSSLALSNVYGSVKFHKKGVIYSLHEAVKNNKKPFINGSHVTRDFVHIDDVVRAIKLAIVKPTNCRVNIATGVETSLISLVEKILHFYGSNLIPDIREEISGEVKRSALDVTKAYKLLNWVPNIGIDQGLLMSLETD